MKCCFFRSLFYLVKLKWVRHYESETIKWMCETVSHLGPELNWTHDLAEGNLERYLATRANAHIFTDFKEIENALATNLQIKWLTFRDYKHSKFSLINIHSNTIYDDISVTLTRPLSTQRVNITISKQFCSQIMRQKSSLVAGRGPWAAMNSRLEL